MAHRLLCVKFLVTTDVLRHRLLCTGPRAPAMGAAQRARGLRYFEHLHQARHLHL
jgi:hypothetical protein